MSKEVSARITELQRTWEERRSATEQARADLINAVIAGHRAGMSEYQLAKLAKVRRGTIRTWLGKKN